jgi:hypothetical protein
LGRFRLRLPRWRSTKEDLSLRTERRAAERTSSRLQVFVYGHVGEEPFAENTETVNVSALGGFMPLSVTPAVSQQVLLTNPETDQDVTCRVARLVSTQGGKVLVGLQFLQSSPDFWNAKSSP